MAGKKVSVKIKKENPKITIKILGAFIGVITLILVFVSFQSSEYRVERAIIVTAPPAAIFANVDDFHRWLIWAPWEKLDPAMKRTFDGPEVGTGSIYHWMGNDKVGEGSMTITETRPKEFIRIKTELLKPAAEITTSEITFKDNGDKTTLVTWAESGSLNYTAKLFNLFNDRDKAVGTDMQNGLEQLKWTTQGRPKS
jgi:hypothetical protein